MAPTEMNIEQTSSSDEVGKFLWSSQSLHEDIWIRSPKYAEETPPKPHSYTSFGDGEGTTVSVNAYGHIMQISRYFGFGSSGLFCVDLEDTDQPYCADSRMEDLMYLSQSSDSGLQVRLQYLLDSDERSPAVGFMYDRWPRYIYNPVSEPPKDSEQPQPHAISEIPSTIISFGLSIQYYCEVGTVFQQYHINFEEMTSFLLDELEIHDYIRIRNLNFLKDQDPYEPEERSSLVRIENLDFVLRQDANENGETGGNNTGKENDAEEKTAGNADNPSAGGRVPGQVKHGFVVTRPINEDEQSVYPEETRSNGPKYIALIIKVFVGNVVQDISESGKIKLDKSVKDIAENDKRLEITIAYRLQLLSKTQYECLSSESVPLATSTMEPDCMQKVFSVNNRYEKIRFARDCQLDFITRRNLEHILSVCCIPIWDSPTFGEIKADASRGKPGSSDLKATAITCGDISGHRVGSKATL
jgi:hypothetical protein